MGRAKIVPVSLRVGQRVDLVIRSGHMVRLQCARCRAYMAGGERLVACKHCQASYDLVGPYEYVVASA
jgi:hypothetical protein